jgi:hypothetical protein
VIENGAKGMLKNVLFFNATQNSTTGQSVDHQRIGFPYAESSLQSFPVLTGSRLPNNLSGLSSKPLGASSPN